MDLLTISRLAWLLGGLCWVARMLLFLAGSGSGLGASALFWLGSLLIGAGLVGAGANLVSSSATWLRLIVGVAFPLLVWSVLQVIHDIADPRAVDGVLGLVFAVLAALALARSPRSPGSGRSQPPSGSRQSTRPGERRRTRERRTRPTRGAHAR
jgi:hypothetical protein